MLFRSLLAIVMATGIAGSSTAAFAQAAASQASITWQTSRIPWVAQPDGVSSGAAPQLVVVPPQQYAYGVRSAPVNVFAAKEPVILQLTVGDVSGSIGALILSTESGAALSKEGMLKPGADNVLYFRVRPGMPASMIVLRNVDAEGKVGAATIRSLKFVREVDLDNEALAALAASGLH